MKSETNSKRKEKEKRFKEFVLNKQNTGVFNNKLLKRDYQTRNLRIRQYEKNLSDLDVKLLEMEKKIELYERLKPHLG